MSLQNSVESINFIRPVSVPGTELLIANNSGRKWRVFHETYSFCAVAQGAARYSYRGKELFMNDRNCALMEPGEAHSSEAFKHGNFKVLLVSPEIFTDAAREFGMTVTPHLRSFSNYDPKLFWMLYRFCAAVETGASVLEQQSLFAACLSIVLKQAEQKPFTLSGMNEHCAVATIKLYLQERFSAAVSLDELVALTGLSRFHLVRTFAKQVGMPPHIYQINIRMARAITLLKAGVLPSRVSTDLGFADQSHFTKHFKRCWGATPSNYAKAAI